jgi:CubicO group peptidase (beta-lactamase class C family)
MTSGLQFAQSRRNPYSDLNAVMFLKRDIAAYAASRPADSRPGSKWAFSSGSTAIASNVMRHALGGSQSDYFTWPRRALFGPLGMDSAVFEPDAAGTFAGSNSIYATARDWARLGLFFLRDGIWLDRRILPRQWVRQSTTPTPGSGGDYGAHFWLRVPEDLRPKGANPVALPDDAYFLFGFGGQIIAIIPSRDLVIFRSGIGRYRGAWDPALFVERIVRAFPAKAR